MLNRKRLGFALVAVVLCLATVFVSNPVSALSSSVAPITSAVVPEAPPVEQESPAPVSKGHMVSLVHQHYYASSTIIGCLENGTKIKVLSAKKKDFYQIDCYDMKGYIAKSQVIQNENGEYFVNCVEGSEETKYLPSYTVQETLALRGKVLEIAKSCKGIKYVWGGTSRRGFDCSGFTQYIYRNAGIDLNRSATKQLQDGVIIAYEDMQVGDLIYFTKTSTGGLASHIGMYIGNGMMIHSGASRGVVIVDLSISYWQDHYLCARRILISDVTAAAVIPVLGQLENTNASFWRESSET